MKRAILITLVALCISNGNVLACGGGCKMGGSSCGSNDSCGESGRCSCATNRPISKDILPQMSLTLESAIEVQNILCPVTGKKTSGMGEVVKYQYNGKAYNLCCDLCIAKFEKDPEKYSKIAEAKT